MPHLAAVVLLHAVAELAEVAVSPEPAVIVVNRRDESPCEQAHQHSIRACTPASPRPELESIACRSGARDVWFRDVAL